MSDAPVETVSREPEARRPLTPEASNILGWWWLTIAFTILLIAAIWPNLFTEGTSAFGTYLGVVISLALVAAAAWIAAGFSRAQVWSVGAMRMTTIIGLVVGVLAVGFFLYSVAFATPASAGPGQPASPGFFGSTPILSGFLWVILIVLPFIFGLLVIFGLMTDAVDEWLNPPVVDSPTHPNLRIDPATAAIMAGSAGAVSHAVSDEALMSELSQVMTIDEAGRRTGRMGDEQSVEVVGQAEDDLSVQIVGGDVTQDEGSIAELAALEEALSEDAAKKKAKKKKKDEKKKPSTGSGDEPLSVDDDFKL